MNKIVTGKTRSSRKFARVKTPILICVVSLIIFSVLICLTGATKKEALTPEQIIAKQEWSEEEIVVAAVQRLRAGGREKNVAAFKHLQTQIIRLPKNAQKQVRERIITRSIDQGLNDYRLLEPAQREKVITALYKQAEKRRKAIEEGRIKLPDTAKMTSEQLKEVEESKKEAGRTLSHIMDKLSPEERRDLAPLIKEWVQIAENF